jgi:hypothetical protein
MPFELGVTFVTLSVGGFVWGGGQMNLLKVGLATSKTKKAPQPIRAKATYFHLGGVR